MNGAAGEGDAGAAARRVRRVAAFLIAQGGVDVLLSIPIGIFWILELGSVRGEMGPVTRLVLFLMFAAALGGGMLKLRAGLRTRELRDHRLGVWAIWSGLLSLATCWGGPTGLLLLVYGLGAYADPGVAACFRNAEAQRSASPPTR